MSKQNSVLKVKGELDDVSFYKSGNKLLARKTHRVEKSRILTGPSYQRTRENMSEFGAALAAAKSFRQSFNGAKTMMDARVSNRLTSLFKKVLNLDPAGIRGQRAIQFSQHKEMLNQLEFNLIPTFAQSCTAFSDATLNAARNEGTISITQFNPMLQVDFPKGATHCKLVQAIGVFVDLEYNPATEKYQPVNEVPKNPGAIARSALLAKEALPQDVSFTVALPDAPVIEPETTLIQCLGIEFYQLIGGREYILAGNNAMAVVNIQ